MNRLTSCLLALLACPLPGGGAEAHRWRAREAPVPESYFGMHIHRAVPLAGDLTRTAWPAVPFGAWRLWDARVGWPSLEPDRGAMDFALLDRYLALAESAHVEVLLPLGLSPAWAAARPQESSAYRPGNASEPKDLDSWVSFVDAVVSRYRGRIGAYEVWNEPNLRQFFSGHVDDMLRLAAAAYPRIKASDPGAIVVSPAPTGARGLQWLESYLAAGGGKWADVIGYHFYVAQNQSPEDVARLVRQVRQLVDRHGLRAMPIWNTETGWRLGGRQPHPPGWTPSRGLGDPGLPDTLASAYVARALVLGWVSGLDRFYWYSWDHYSMGLVEPDGSSPKPAAQAYATMRDWLLGSRITLADARPDGMWLVRVDRPMRPEAVIVWGASRATRYVPPASWRGATRHDLWGNRDPLPVRQLREGFVVGASPVLVERAGS